MTEQTAESTVTDEQLHSDLKSDWPGIRRQAELLLTVNEADRLWLSSAARIQRNMTGGRYSDALSSSIRAFKRGVLTRESHEEYRAQITREANQRYW